MSVARINDSITSPDNQKDKMTDDNNPQLQDAYKLQTPDDNVRLYQRWSATYDAEFAGVRGYVYPEKIAELYSANATGQDAPVLDVGAGTGLVGSALKQRGEALIDGIDISKEMLDTAAEKNVYRRLIVADLTQDIPIEANLYGAVVSAGTFTHGHVGPMAIKELLRIARPGALFCLGINATAFDKYGFGSALAEYSSDKLIESLHFERINYYDKTGDEHSGDRGFAALFRKPTL